MPSNDEKEAAALLLGRVRLVLDKLWLLRWCASKAMKAQFSDKILANTSTPAWLHKGQVSTWLVSQVKKSKDLRKEKQRKEDGHHKHKHKKRLAKTNIRGARKAERARALRKYARAPRAAHHKEPIKQHRAVARKETQASAEET